MCIASPYIYSSLKMDPPDEKCNADENEDIESSKSPPSGLQRKNNDRNVGDKSDSLNLILTERTAESISSDLHEHEAEVGQNEQLEWTYEDHNRTTSFTTITASELYEQEAQRRLHRKVAYEEMERSRKRRLMILGIGLLLLDIAAATVAYVNYHELMECCGQTILPNDEQWK